MDSKGLALWFLLVSLSPALLLYCSACPLLCSCMYQGGGGANGTGLRTVACKDPAIVMIPADLPTDTAKLRLQRTSVVRVSKGSFETLDRLRYLWLTYNSITTLHPRSFANLSVLHELRLDGNLLTMFPWDALRDTPRLRSLVLHNNRLSRVPVQAARFLGNLTYLDLSGNRLSTLPNEVMAALSFYPSFNPTDPQRRVVLGLHDNMWMCDCRLALLLELSRGTVSNLILLDPYLICSAPKDISGSPLQEVNLPHCVKPSVLTSTTKIVTAIGSNVMVRCDATGFPTPVLIWIKSSGADINNTGCCDDINTIRERLPRRLPSFLQLSPRVGIRWSVFSLNGISYRDAGEYRCRAHNMAGSSEASITLEVVGIIDTKKLYTTPTVIPPLNSSSSVLESAPKRKKSNSSTKGQRDKGKREKMKRNKMRAKRIK